MAPRWPLLRVNAAASGCDIYNPRQGQVKQGQVTKGHVKISHERRKSPFSPAFTGGFPCLGGREPISSKQPSEAPSPPRMRAVLDIILIILDLYVWLLIASAILSWLIAFNVVNTRNQFVAAVAEFLYRITEPVLAPIRSVMPNLGGLDISPIILILIIMFIERVINYYIYPSVF
jgi:YggT family protein